MARSLHFKHTDLKFARACTHTACDQTRKGVPDGGDCCLLPKGVHPIDTGRPLHQVLQRIGPASYDRLLCGTSMAHAARASSLHASVRTRVYRMCIPHLCCIAHKVVQWKSIRNPDRVCTFVCTRVIACVSSLCPYSVLTWYHIQLPSYQTPEPPYLHHFTPHASFEEVEDLPCRTTRERVRPAFN